MLKVAGVRFGRSSFRLLGGAVNSGRSAVVVGELGPRLCTASVVGWFRLRCGVQEVVPLLRCSPPSCSSPPVWTVAVWHTFGCHHVRTAPRCWTKCLLRAEVVKEVVKSQSVVEQSHYKLFDYKLIELTIKIIIPVQNYWFNYKLHFVYTVTLV